MIKLVFIIVYFACGLYSREECKRSFSIRKNSIILTKSSLSEGATFIHKHVVSKFSDCYALCCSNPDCTVAVYENKVNHNCFMFNCKVPNVCLFTEHEHYVSVMYMKDISQPSITDTPISRVNSAQRGVSIDAKLGDNCGSLRKCEPENSMCTSGTCICQIGFIGKNGRCVRSLCPKPELMFQCNDVTKSPFCVAIYDQCNGLSECGDGSDELHCNGIIKAPKNRSNFTISNHEYNFAKDRVNHKESPKNAPKQNDNFPITQSYDIQKTNLSHLFPENHNNEPQRRNILRGSYSTNPRIENQLLGLESKNNLPRYPDNVHSANKNDRHHHQSNSNGNSKPVSLKEQYRKLKSNSYPHITRIDDYYQKPEQDQSDNYNKWNMDPTYTDYEYPQINGNGRERNSEWYQDQTPYQLLKHQDTVEKPQQDRYPYYQDYDEMESRPRDKYITENDYTNAFPKNVFEISMNHKKEQDKQNKKVNRIFIKPKSYSKEFVMQTTTPDSQKLDENSISEWSTAVVALSLGLLVTAAMLMAVAYKMRTWRRRLRKGKKGKPLLTDDGDYLVNGMYL